MLTELWDESGPIYLETTDNEQKMPALIQPIKSDKAPPARAEDKKATMRKPGSTR